MKPGSLSGGCPRKHFMGAFHIPDPRKLTEVRLATTGPTP